MKKPGILDYLSRFTCLYKLLEFTRKPAEPNKVTEKQDKCNA